MRNCECKYLQAIDFSLKCQEAFRISHRFEKNCFLSLGEESAMDYEFRSLSDLVLMKCGELVMGDNRKTWWDRTNVITDHIFVLIAKSARIFAILLQFLRATIFRGDILSCTGRSNEGVGHRDTDDGHHTLWSISNKKIIHPCTKGIWMSFYTLVCVF